MRSLPRSHSDENCISVADAILNCHLKIENVFSGVYDLNWDIEKKNMKKKIGCILEYWLWFHFIWKIGIG